MKNILLEKETIEQLYHKDNLTLQEVAKKLDVCKDTVRRNMRHYGIPHKSPKVYRQGICSETKAKLPLAKKLYFDEQHPFRKVCQMVGISFYTLQRLFTENSLCLRSTREVTKLAWDKRRIDRGFQKGEKHPRYNGYRTQEDNGYIRVYMPKHPRAGKNGYIPEQNLVWEEYYKKLLPRGWLVHHLNGIKNDNRIENLVAMSSKKHSLVLAEKAKRIQFLEKRVRELETLLEGGSH